MKRLMRLALAVLVVLALAGCGGSGAQPGGPDQAPASTGY
jgi:hypothetical protein